MVVDLVALVMDSSSPRELAQFWARALGWDVNTKASGELQVLPTDPTSFRLLVRKGGGAKVAQNPIHLGLPDDPAGSQPWDRPRR